MENNPFKSEKIVKKDTTPEIKATEFKPETRRASIDYQSPDIVTAIEIDGFGDMKVAVTLEKKRENRKTENKNQDNVIADPASGIFGVFDGLGGGNNPAEASHIAARVLAANWDIARASVEDDNENVAKHLDATFSEKNAKKILATEKEMTIKANALLSLFHWADQAASDVQGMTTACAGFIHTTKDGTRYLVTANVGDSGAFILHADENLEQATSDDSELADA
ncbi:MAG: protein phosphatase 2C domain-containing protein [Patescibacteria group bacterium]